MRLFGRPSRASSAAPGGVPSFFVAPVGDEAVEGNTVVPDLLHETARPWGDLRGSAALVRFGFEGGDCAGVFETLVRGLPLDGGASAPSSNAGRPGGATTQGPDSLSAQLYLDQLIQACFAFSIDGKPQFVDKGVLRRILTAGPCLAEDRALRQAILRDLLDHPPLRANLERLYAAVLSLRRALETTDGAEPNIVRRKITVLVALQEAVNALADGFDTEASALGRLRELGQALRASSGWDKVKKLVDMEGNVATVDVRLRLGADGGVRGFSVLAIRESSDNDLLPGPLTRLFQRFVSFLRGYRYGDTELVVRLLEEVFAPWTEAVVVIEALTGALAFYLSALGFAHLAKDKGLDVCLPTLLASAEDGPAETRVLEGLFNPLLLLQGVKPRPIDLPEGPHDALVVLTGPNSGGKTRLLQSIALAQLLAQAGCFVPAKRARLVVAPRIFLSLGAEEAADQVEGRLGTELLRVRRLFEELEPGALAILDELCSGTNPLEGEAIFEDVLSLLAQLRPQVFVSTHFLGLAARLERERPIEGLAFLQVELDEEERPTYRFREGVATTSLAHKVAERLGVTRDGLEALVKKRSGGGRLGK
jgi:DNA mismatch repair protein MutS2